MNRLFPDTEATTDAQPVVKRRRSCTTKVNTKTYVINSGSESEGETKSSRSSKGKGKGKSSKEKVKKPKMDPDASVEEVRSIKSYIPLMNY